MVSGADWHPVALRKADPQGSAATAEAALSIITVLYRAWPALAFPGFINWNTAATKGAPMILRREFLKVGAGLASITILAGCGRSAELRYRITVEVDTPDGLRKGSSVIQLDVEDPGRGGLVLPDVHPALHISGEAVAVDLPGGKTLFVLLNKPGFPDGAGYIPREALSPSKHSEEYGAIHEIEEMNAMTKVGVLPPYAFPTFVTFGDLADPISVKEVNPENLAASFGQGVSLRRITVQMTDAPMTKEIEKKLPWVKGSPEDSIIPEEYRKDFNEIDSLRKGDFKRR